MLRSLVKGNGDIVVECCMISENILKNFRGKYRRIQMKAWIMLLQGLKFVKNWEVIIPF